MRNINVKNAILAVAAGMALYATTAMPAAALVTKTAWDRNSGICPYATTSVNLPTGTQIVYCGGVAWYALPPGVGPK